MLMFFSLYMRPDNEITLEDFKKQIAELFRNFFEVQKLGAIEFFINLTARFFLVTLTLISLLIGTVFLSILGVQILSDVFQSEVMGYAIITSLYFLIAVVIQTVFKKMIFSAVANNLVSIVFKAIKRDSDDKQST